MSHIVIDAREYSTSTGRYVSKLIHELELLDTVNYFSILLKPKDMERVKLSNPHFTKVACPFKEFTFQEQLGYLKLLNSLKPDLVHFGKTEQPVLYRGKTVTTVHDLINALHHNPSRYRNPVYFKFKQQVYRWVIKRVARSSQIIITPTTFIKNQLAGFTGIDSAKITVTYEAADKITEPATPLPGLQNKNFIMYVGRPTKHKNLGHLIDAFQELQRDHPALQLVLAGKTDDNYREHAARVVRDNIPNVMFTDFISDGQLRWLYEHCSAYVFPSLSEGFGLPGLEAMTHGAPVVSSNATCLPEVYGDAARYFDPIDPVDMAAQIAAVLDDSELRKKLISAGKLQAGKYSWRRMAEQTLKIYTEVLDQK